MRQLLIFLLVLVGIWWLRRALRRPDDSAGGTAGRGQRRRDDNPERMLACAHCGVHVPESEGIQSGGDFYCCEEHRRQGPGR